MKIDAFHTPGLRFEATLDGPSLALQIQAEDGRSFTTKMLVPRRDAYHSDDAHRRQVVQDLARLVGLSIVRHGVGGSIVIDGEPYVHAPPRALTDAEVADVAAGLRGKRDG